MDTYLSRALTASENPGFTPAGPSPCDMGDWAFGEGEFTFGLKSIIWLSFSVIGAIRVQFRPFVGSVSGLASGTGTITQSYSQVNAAGDSYVGGLIGITEGTSIAHCYSQGSVTGYNYVAGLIGRNESRIKYCYSRSWVSANWRCRGLIGLGFEGFTTESFWDIETSGHSESFGGVGLTTLEMQDVKNYLNAGWDFMDETVNGTNDLWGFNSGENDGYPFLQWQSYLNLSGCQALSLPADSIVFGYIKITGSSAHATMTV